MDKWLTFNEVNVLAYVRGYDAVSFEMLHNLGARDEAEVDRLADLSATTDE